MNVTTRQMAAMVLSRHTDQGARPPWTATTPKTHTRTPDGRNADTISFHHLLPFPSIFGVTHQVCWCKYWQQVQTEVRARVLKGKGGFWWWGDLLVEAGCRYRTQKCLLRPAFWPFHKPLWAAQAGTWREKAVLVYQWTATLSDMQQLRKTNTGPSSAHLHFVDTKKYNAH